MQSRLDKLADLIPVTVLTGFLGSGKTTLLARLLRHPSLADTAVIINEFGEVGLDHLLVAKGEENVVLLDSGCLCCTISNTLSETLGDLYFRRVRGEVPCFRRAVIETTGLADPAPILHALMTDYFVAAHYALDGIVATVDALHGEAQLDQHVEAVKQTALADRLVITKTDLVGAAMVDGLRRRLRALNPSARILEAVQGALDPVDILDVGLFDPARKSVEVQRWLREEVSADAEADEHHGFAGHAHDHDHPASGRHDDGIRTFSFQLDGAVTWQGYAAWLAAIRALPGQDLLRVKGLVAVEGDPLPYVIQGVQHVFSPPLRLPAWPSDDRRSRLVFITRNIDRQTVAATLPLLHDPAAADDRAVAR